MLNILYRYIRALSLDVVLGSVICSHFLGTYLQIEIPQEMLLVLALAVWVIYTADHLWDAYKMQDQARFFRHQFHLKYFTLLTILVIAASSIAVALLPQFPPATLIVGTVISVLVALYFIMLHVIGSKPTFAKEIMIALVYTLGVFAAPVSLSPVIDLPLVFIFVQFVLLALVNLLEFAYFELELDREQQFGSAVQFWGRDLTKQIVLSCLLIVITLAGFCVMWWSENTMLIRAEIILSLMAVSLALIIAKPGFFKTSERFRILGDGIFFFPGLLLFI